MTYTIDYLEDKTIIHIKVKGRVNFQIAEKYSKEAVKIARDKDCSKFIVDHKETSINANKTNIYCTGEDLQQFGFRSSDKIAIIIKVLKNSSSLKDAKGDNINWSTFKYFGMNEIEKAYNWLTG